MAFADYEPLPEGRVGHPAGLEWFCPEHLEGGLALQHWKRDPAVAKLGGAVDGKSVPAPNTRGDRADPKQTPPPGKS